ncbi:MAG: hypothetical protein AB9842_00755 [Bacteroidales bacterium]
MTRIILSFDHELPLGGVYKDYDHALFEPTRNILRAAEKENVKLCLFTDILSFLFFKKHGVIEFTEPYIRQLQEAVSNGHEVQLHLHPHWIHSKYENGAFYPSPLFSLADFAGEAYPGNIEGIIEQGIQELTAICQQVKPDYRCTAFRAGGFNLFPETSRILNSLYKNGILIDSSIPKGLYYKSAYSLINYRDMPPQCNWFIPLEGPLNRTSNKGMFEIPIATKPAGLLTNLRHLYFKRKHKNHAYLSGKTIHSGNVGKLDKLRFVFSVRMLGFDTYSMKVDDLMKILRYNLSLYKDNPDIILDTVSHPKNIGPYGVALMTGFVQAARKEIPGIEFVTHEQVITSMQH